MRIFQGIKRTFKPLVDFPTWMGYRSLKDNGRAVIQGTKSLFSTPEAGPEETFEQAVDRFKLAPEDITKREKIFLVLALLWSTIALALLIYTIWLVLNDGIVGALLSAALTFLAFVLAFRYHFWYFQVKNRLLGANLKQWLNSWLKVK